MPKTKKIKNGEANGVAEKKSRVAVPCHLQPFYQDRAACIAAFGDASAAKDSAAHLSVEQEPFRYCVMRNLLEDAFLPQLRAELSSLRLREKSNDLYQFRQSGELNRASGPCLTGLRETLLTQVKPIIAEMTGIELNEKLALFYAEYRTTDHLLVHDDELEGRRVAFILYLTPEWSKEDGGSLDLFSVDDQCQPACIVQSLVPEHNSFAFFEVSPVSFHQVREVLAENKTRLSLGGWFHGADIQRPEKPPFPLLSTTPFIQDFSEKLFFSMINAAYLNPATQAEIRAKFENSSEICLPDFLSPEAFAAAAQELRSLEGWQLTGPPNRQHYWRLEEPPSECEALHDIWQLFKSEPFFLLLSNLTGLRLHELAPEDSEGEESNEEKVYNPRCRGELRKWEQGCYTLIRDDDLGQAEFVLDARLAFNSAGWQPDMGGQTVYIARGEDEELITVEPSDNTLNLVYRDKESLRFVKYLNKNTTKIGKLYDIDFLYYE